LLTAAGGLLLLVSLFLHWYQPALSAWTVFEVWDLVLAVLALAALWTALAHYVWEAPLRQGALPALGLGAFVIVVSQLINHPPAAQGASPQIGAWLGLFATAVMATGGVLSATGVSLSMSFSTRERRRPAPPPAAAAPPPEPPRSREPSPATEARVAEPEVHEELYPAEERSGPIGADDPEPWSGDPSEDETLPFEPRTEEQR
jgi:hypothetical protein